MNKRFVWISIIIILVTAAGYFIYRQNQRQQPYPVKYTEPHSYSITYPSNWKKEVRGTSGREILALYNYDYKNGENAGSDFNPREIKIALSILDKGSLSLEQIIAQKFTSTEKGYQKEILSVDGRPAIRISVSFFTDQGSSPMIQTFIDYKNNQYALFIGYYDGSKKSVKEINKILGSFKVLD